MTTTLVADSGLRGSWKAGISVADTRCMVMASDNPKVQNRQPAESAGILRWVFLRGTKVLTCEVRVCGRQMYDVGVVPHWDISSSVVETFDRPGRALLRHAEIAWSLRQAGWSLAREGACQPVHVAA